MRKYIIIACMMFPLLVKAQGTPYLSPFNLKVQGYKLTPSAFVQPNDSVLVAIGKLQAQINALTGAPINYIGHGIAGTYQSDNTSGASATLSPLYNRWLDNTGAVTNTIGITGSDLDFKIFGTTNYLVNLVSPKIKLTGQSYFLPSSDAISSMFLVSPSGSVGATSYLEFGFNGYSGYLGNARVGSVTGSTGGGSLIFQTKVGTGPFNTQVTMPRAGGLIVINLPASATTTDSLVTNTQAAGFQKRAFLSVTQGGFGGNTAPATNQIPIATGTSTYAPTTIGGDLTNSLGVFTIGANKVSYAKFQQSVGSSILLGAQTAGNFSEISLGASLTMSGSVLNAIQDIRTTASPQFSKIGLGISPTYNVDAASTGMSLGRFATTATSPGSGSAIVLIDGSTINSNVSNSNSLQIKTTGASGFNFINDGTFNMLGTTSGTYGVKVPATITSYSLTAANAAPSSNGQVMSYTTAGIGSWVSPFINPMTTAGDGIYGGASGVATRFSGNATATNKFLTQVSGGVPVYFDLFGTSNIFGSTQTFNNITITGALATNGVNYQTGFGASFYNTANTFSTLLYVGGSASANYNVKIPDATGTIALTNQVALNVASSDLTAQTAANSSVATYTVGGGGTGTFRIGAYLNITAVTLDVIQIQVNYTDENSNTRTATFFGMGTTSAGLSTVGNSNFGSVDIRCKASTAITITTTLTTSTGSITYDVGGTIQQLR
jgi:hypothetical protein